MASCIFLKNLPKTQILRDLARRYPDLEPSAVEAYLAVLKVASDIMARIDVEMLQHRMSQGRFSIMMQLNIDSAGVSPSDLAERTGVTRATITGLLDGLEREGFVRRDKPGGDRRALVVRLTPKGQRHLDRMVPKHYQRVSALMARLNGKERKLLIELIMKVAAGIPAMGLG